MIIYPLALLVDRGGKQGSLQLGNLDKIFGTYKLLIGDNQLPLKLPDTTINGFLASATSQKPTFYELLAMRAARGVRFTGAQHPKVLASMRATDETTAAAIADRICCYTAFHDLVTNAASQGLPQERLAALKVIQRPEKEPGNVELHAILINFEHIITSLGASNTELFTKLSRWYEKDSDPPPVTDTTIFNYLPIYEAAALYPSKLSTFLIEEAIMFFNNQDEGFWRNELAKPTSFNLQLICFLLSRELLTALPPKAIRPYQEYLSQVTQEYHAIWPPSNTPRIWHNCNVARMRQK